MNPRRRALLVLLAVGALGAACAGIAACLDATPVTVTMLPGDASAGDDGSAVADAVGDAGDAAPVETGPSACVVCLQTPDKPGPGCQYELAACDTNPECAQALACAVAHGCFDRGSVAALIACGLPCAAEAGIVTFTDPALDLAYNVFQCAGGPCGSPCNLGDAALP